MYSRTRAHSIRWGQCQHVQLTVKLLLFFFFVFRDLVIRIRELRVVNLLRKKKTPKTLPVGVLFADANNPIKGPASAPLFYLTFIHNGRGFVVFSDETAIN